MSPRYSDREWREWFDRDQRQFDRMWRVVFPIALTLGVLGALATIVFWAGAAAWVWSVVQ